ncbi:MAG: SDR family oxidoreductase [Bacteroidales bacterium]
MSINRKVAFITGASSGIGKAIAMHFLKLNYKVYGTSRKKTEQKEDNIFFLQMDVNDDISVQKACQEFTSKENNLDLLINCAGLGINGSVEEMPINEVKSVFETNFFGPLRVCQQLIPLMRKQKKGHIINVSSIAGEAGLPFRGFYSASKFALEGMTESLRMELRAYNIKVCLLQPGDFNTNIANARKGTGIPKNSPYQKFLEQMEQQIEEGMNKSPKPDCVGPFVENIIKKKNPKLRYRVGAKLETITPILKCILPYKIYEALILKFYNMK